MSTTTIRLDEQLKARLASAAERAGTTAHAFILDAIERTIEQSELEEAFHRVAEQRWATLLASGKSIAWDEASAYIAARARGERPRKPKARQLKR
ncbi:ribbon-helix-helix protein, CopG family [Thiomonas sp.]|uniref:ribbon-helix-helix protein, CopG family n=1 Tax=Thiomonas sp. TaxID=2047785 RepID=UPI00261A4B20|nr:ribbon-helix-helix protein, CopG family [Thiomonas sp.]